MKTRDAAEIRVGVRAARDRVRDADPFLVGVVFNWRYYTPLSVTAYVSDFAHTLIRKL